MGYFTLKPIIAKWLAKFFRVVLLTLFCATVLALSIRGMAGNPTPAELNTQAWKDNGPLELSPERGRYALLYSLTETGSFAFNKEIAAFAAPDVAYHDGKYVSLFAPGISYLAIPGYLFGKTLGLAQVGSFAMIAVFAILNFFLIRAIAIQLGAQKAAATLGGIAFLFASPAFAYAVTLYQHHVSTFLILMALYLLIRSKSVLSLTGIWLLCGISIAVDYPNFFMMLPLGLFALGRTFIFERKEKILKLSIPVLRVLAVAAIIIPLTFFFWFNKASYGNPLTLSGSIERAIEVKPNGTPVLESEVLKKQLEEANHKNVQVEEKNITAFFHPRNLMNGFYTHFISPDRGVLLFAPIMLLGALGMLVFRKHKKYLALFTAIVGANVLLYSMWGDPYGGWAFGSRYLIPTYAVLAIFIATLLTKLNKNIIFLILFFLTLSYSVGVNTLGALTSNRNPPRIEVQELQNKSGIKQEYTYARNMQLLDSGESKSYVYQTFAKDQMSAWNYYFTVAGIILAVSAGLVTYIAAAAIKNAAAPAFRAVDKTIISRRKDQNAV